MRNKGVQQWSYKNHQTINKLITNKMKKTLFLAIERYKSDVQIQCDIWNRRNVNASFPCHLNHLLQYSGLKLLSPEEYKKVQDEIIESLHKLL